MIAQGSKGQTLANDCSWPVGRRRQRSLIGRDNWVWRNGRSGEWSPVVLGRLRESGFRQASDLSPRCEFDVGIFQCQQYGELRSPKGNPLNDRAGR